MGGNGGKWGEWGGMGKLPIRTISGVVYTIFAQNFQPISLSVLIWGADNLQWDVTHPMVGVHVPHCLQQWDKGGHVLVEVPVEGDHVLHTHLPGLPSFSLSFPEVMAQSTHPPSPTETTLFHRLRGSLPVFFHIISKTAQFPPIFPFP